MSTINELSIQKKVISSEQNLSIEIVRLIACFGVISIHVHSNTLSAINLSKTFSIFCVPFFFATGLTFFTKGLTKEISINNILIKMWKRIGIPFIAWSTIYTGLILVKSIITSTGKPITISTIGRIYLYGESSEHLYFLPELAIIQIICLSFFLIGNKIRLKIGCGLLFIIMIYLAWGYENNYYGLTPIKSIIVYVITAFFLASRIKQVKTNQNYLVVGILLSLLYIVGDYYNNDEILRKYLFSLPLGGIGLLLVTLHISQFTLPKWAIVLTSTTYGIYLSHVVFLEATEFIIEKLHYKIFYDLPTKIFIISFILAISILFVLFVKQIKLFRVILLGEQ